MLRDFYVYAYLDPRKPGDYNYQELHFDYEPFYIGKGREDRDKSHLKELSQPSARYNKIKRTKILHIIAEAMLPVIIHLQEGLTEQEAWDTEEKAIQQIGRICENTGPLSNFHKGGNGGAQPPEIRQQAVVTRRARGHDTGPNKGKKMSSEQKEKIRQAHLGKKLSDEHKQHILAAREGYHHSEETKQHIRDGQNREKASQKTKQSWQDPEIAEKRRVGVAAAYKRKRELGIKYMWVNNGISSKMLQEDKASVLLEQGWVRGRLKINK